MKKKFVGKVIKGTVTNERLAEMVAAGFGEVHAKFGRMDEQFGRMDERFGRMDERFNVLEKDTEDGFGKVTDAIHELDNRIVANTKKLDDLHTRFVAIEALHTVVGRHDKAIDELSLEVRKIKQAIHLK